MIVPPAGRRRYDSSGRRAQALANRERILRAATRLFREHGYAVTSIAQVAEEAGVSTPTVFAAFKSKVNLLKEAVGDALGDDAEAGGPGDQPVLRRVHEAPSAAEALRRYAEVIADAGRRAGPIYAVAHAAADADPQIAALVADLDRQRLTGAGYVATAVAAKRGDADLSRVGHLRDTIWTLSSPLLHGLLVGQRGWTVEAYREWIATALVALAVPSVRQ
ncbi:helix-turn-helix domain-containing protein [Phytohabitans sp. ZYX-F-186]|uniref:Helix-turn-helix domain-containing protein n=1 Tax=Phytohabitans maris TaxID=3071409 RepID=A0ABU0ZBR6_9ACTN|nr:helix-turn-helix domain-containing protein [Phytohabitans sp. ZYX-F-186]MDQ7904433.1 helix-turn-helix domain-containing protein [Phytohabitans sp. ZYX-F-186]